MTAPYLPLSRVLITGASGFLGHALVNEFLNAGVGVRALDIAAVTGARATEVESIVGDVTDPAVADRACAGCDAVVIAHMAPNRPGVYASAAAPFDINVKGCALMLEAAVRQGVRRVALISSITVVEGHRAGGRKLTTDLPALPTSLYGLTKSLQEDIAFYHHRQSGLEVAALRPAYVTDSDSLTDKYGRHLPSVNWQFVDRRDVAGAALAALRAPKLGFGRYYVHGHPGAADRMDVAPTLTDLGWSPRYDFSAYPEDAPV